MTPTLARRAPSTLTLQFPLPTLPPFLLLLIAPTSRLLRAKQRRKFKKRLKRAEKILRSRIESSKTHRRLSSTLATNHLIFRFMRMKMTKTKTMVLCDEKKKSRARRRLKGRIGNGCTTIFALLNILSIMHMRHINDLSFGWK